MSSSVEEVAGWLTPDLQRRLEAVDRLWQIAPAVMRWFQLPKAKAGLVQPDIRPERREEAQRLLAFLQSK